MPTVSGRPKNIYDKKLYRVTEKFRMVIILSTKFL